MDNLDKEILNEIQWTFPLIPRPYSEMARKFAAVSHSLLNKEIIFISFIVPKKNSKNFKQRVGKANLNPDLN